MCVWFSHMLARVRKYCGQNKKEEEVEEKDMKEKDERIRQKKGDISRPRRSNSNDTRGSLLYEEKQKSVDQF